MGREGNRWEGGTLGHGPSGSDSYYLWDWIMVVKNIRLQCILDHRHQADSASPKFCWTKATRRELPPSAVQIDRGNTDFGKYKPQHSGCIGGGECSPSAFSVNSVREMNNLPSWNAAVRWSNPYHEVETYSNFCCRPSTTASFKTDYFDSIPSRCEFHVLIYVWCYISQMVLQLKQQESPKSKSHMKSHFPVKLKPNSGKRWGILQIATTIGRNLGSWIADGLSLRDDSVYHSNNFLEREKIVTGMRFFHSDDYFVPHLSTHWHPCRSLMSDLRKAGEKS